MPVVFGLFQGLMPLIGYYAVSLASDFVELYAGFIAFAILGIIGGKMVFSGIKAVLAARKPGADTSCRADLATDKNNEIALFMWITPF